MKTVIFSHGKESGPQGTKINRLTEVAQNLGYSVLSVDYRTCATVNERVLLLLQEIKKIRYDQLILVGSSMGGYVATAVANQVPIDGLYLLCPALYRPDYPVQDYHPKCNHIMLVHGWNDTIIPKESSLQFGQQTKAIVHLVNDGHRLVNSLGFLGNSFDYFLKQLL